MFASPCGKQPCTNVSFHAHTDPSLRSNCKIQNNFGPPHLNVPEAFVQLDILQWALLLFSDMHISGPQCVEGGTGVGTRE